MQNTLGELPGSGPERRALRQLTTPQSSLGCISNLGRRRKMAWPSLCMNGDRQCKPSDSFHISRRGAIVGILSGYWGLRGGPEEVQAQQTQMYQRDVRTRGEWYFKDGTWFKKKSADADEDEDEADSLGMKEEEDEKKRAAAAANNACGVF